MTFSIEDVNAAGDFVLFRVGSIVGLILYADIGSPDSTQLQSFVTEAINQIEGKHTVTPTTL
jgi:hypothetical protein